MQVSTQRTTIEKDGHTIHFLQKKEMFGKDEHFTLHIAAEKKTEPVSLWKTLKNFLFTEIW